MSEATKQATGVIDAFPEWYKAALLTDQRGKLGLHGGEDTTDRALAGEWLTLLQDHRVDFTLAWRRLADRNEGPLRALFTDPQQPDAWLTRWRLRAGREALRPQAGKPRQSSCAG